MDTIASISTFDGRDETGEVAANADRVNVLIYVDTSVSLLVALSDLDATSNHFSVMIGAQSYENLARLIGDYKGRITLAWDGGAPGSGKAMITELSAVNL